MTRKILLNLILPVILGAALFAISRPYIVRALESTQAGINYEGITVDTQIDKNGFRQIKMIDSEGNTSSITDDTYTHANPDQDGKYVVWMGLIDSKWQVFIYDISTEKTVQLTHSGNNVNPKISGDDVVWEGFVDNVWQIFHFDGTKKTQITNGNEPSQNASIKDGSIAYTQYGPDGWKAYMIDLETDYISNLDEGDEVKDLRIRGESIYWTSLKTGKRREYELNKKDGEIINTEVEEGPDWRKLIEDEEKTKDGDDETKYDAFDDSAYEEFVQKLNDDKEDAIDPLLENQNDGEKGKEIQNNADTSLEEIKEEIGIEKNETETQNKIENENSDTAESEEIEETQESTSSN